MGSSSASLPASTSCKVATAVNILFIEPMRNLRRRGVRSAGLPVGAAPGVLEQDLPVAGDQHGTGELVGPSTLARRVPERRQRVRLGHPVQDEINGARRLRGDQELNPAIGVSADSARTECCPPRHAEVLDCRSRRGGGEPSGPPKPTRPCCTSVGWLRFGSPGDVWKTLTSTSPSATESMGAEGSRRSIRNCWFGPAAS